MTALTDEGLAEVAGQGLFVSDYIAPNSLTGAGATGGNTDFGFYRMGLDVEVAMNANIDKLQLGCGGFNESAAGNSCDIDMDFVRLMGLNAAGNGPSTAGAASDFILKRPYVEIAVKGSGTTREVAGIKIGSEEANGYFGVGRQYANGAVNQETGVTCQTGGAAGNAGAGAARGACHSGVSRISAYLNVELSAVLPLTNGVSGYACFGLLSSSVPNGGDCYASDTAGVWKNGKRLYAEIIGTRVATMRQVVELDLDATALGFISIDHAYANLVQDLKTLHGFSLDGTSDFFLSFQRQEIAYPTYDKSGYAYPANAGWWMNVPDVTVTDVQGATVDLGGLFAALGNLAYPGGDTINSDLGVAPPINCYGGYGFC
ncbi:MAG: hypothetical protein P1U67_04020 [Alcanivoracaceae bacterium]|nr:hypothetical protein [Alcanivoracaceae bacterium]